MTLGQRISQHRKALGISQEELGERLGVSRQAVSKWETDASSPDMENLLALAREFGVSVAELTETKHPPKRNWLLLPLCGLLGAALIGLFLLISEQGPSGAPAPPPLTPNSEFALMWDDGYFELGMPELPDDTGSPTIRESPYDDLEYHDFDCGDITLTYGVRPSTGEALLLAAQTSSRVYETPRGIGVGSTEADILSAYGDSLIYCLPQGNDASSAECMYAYAPDSNLLFYLTGGHVTSICLEHASYGPCYNVNNCDSFPVQNGAPDFSDRIQRPVSTEQQVYDALNALITRTDLTAEELHIHRNTIFGSLQDLDWQIFGALGVTKYPEDTMETLLSWLHEQAPWSEAEISCLQRGIQSKPDGFLAESYNRLLCKAFFSTPTVFVRHLALNGDCAEDVITSVAFDAVWYPGELDAALETLHTSSFSQAEAAWYQRLLETLKEYNVFTA